MATTRRPDSHNNNTPPAPRWNIHAFAVWSTTLKSMWHVRGRENSSVSLFTEMHWLIWLCRGVSIECAIIILSKMKLYYFLLNPKRSLSGVESFFKWCLLTRSLQKAFYIYLLSGLSLFFSMTQQLWAPANAFGGDRSRKPVTSLWRFSFQKCVFSWAATWPNQLFYSDALAFPVASSSLSIRPRSLREPPP